MAPHGNRLTLGRRSERARVQPDDPPQRHSDPSCASGHAEVRGDQPRPRRADNKAAHDVTRWPAKSKLNVPPGTLSDIDDCPAAAVKPYRYSTLDRYIPRATLPILYHGSIRRRPPALERREQPGASSTPQDRASIDVPRVSVDEETVPCQRARAFDAVGA